MAKKKLSLKWKLFLVFSYIQLIAFGLFFLLLTLFIVNGNYSTSEDVFVYFLVSLGFFSICFNSLTNIRTIHRYFPDQLLPASTKTVINVFGGINIFLLIGLLILFIAGLQVELEIKERQKNHEWIIVFTLSSLLLSIIGLYTVILQLQMNKYLTRKNKDKVDSLINLIGKTE